MYRRSGRVECGAASSPAQTQPRARATATATATATEFLGADHAKATATEFLGADYAETADRLRERFEVQFAPANSISLVTALERQVVTGRPRGSHSGNPVLRARTGA